MPIVSCLPEETPIVKWTYPNELQQQIEGNEYQIIGAREYARWYLRYKPNPYYRETGIAYEILDGEAVAELWTASNGRNMFAVKGWSPSMAEDYTGTFPPYYEEIKASKPGYIPVGADKTIFADAEIIRHEKQLFISWEYVEEDVTFIVKNNGVTVFSRTDSSIPQIETECVIQTNQCPENTCEVDCGTHICCYGSDGIAVHSFEK